MILEETLHHLEDQGALDGRRIRALHLTPYFTVVELDDGAVGAGMSYYRLEAAQTAAVHDELTAALAGDPLLRGWAWQAGARRRPGLAAEHEPALVNALRLATVSALSARILRAGGDATFSASSSAPPDPFAGVRRALVVGFGGYLDHLAQADAVEELHISDLLYGEEGARMEAAVAPYRQRFPGKRITLSDGRDTARRLREADAVAITGSALANGTLEGLLRHVGPNTRVVVQGQSAAVHPLALFERGVHLVVTTLKPPELVQLAAADPSGEAMRPLLEGGLPALYCSPR